ncbi:uncharacterized protein B0I36DRAFT_398323, partial [Microdochium trichocladiopsis]
AEAEARTRHWLGWFSNDLVRELHRADQDLFEALIKTLVAHGANLYEWPLAVAPAAAGNLVKVRFIVESGAMSASGTDQRVREPDTTTPWMLRALHTALWNGQVDIVRYLLEHGPDPAARAVAPYGYAGWTALHIAMRGPDKTLVTMVGLILEHAGRRHSSGTVSDLVDCRTTGVRLMTPLECLLFHGRHAILRRKEGYGHPHGAGCAQTVQLLLDRSIDLATNNPIAPSPDQEWHRVLYCAAHCQCYACIRVVLAKMGYERAAAIIGDKNLYKPDKPWRLALGQAWQDEFGDRIEEQQRRRRWRRRQRRMEIGEAEDVDGVVRDSSSVVDSSLAARLALLDLQNREHGMV